MGLPPWLLSGKTPQEKGRGFEKKMAKKCKSTAQPGSGNTPHYKEDFQPGEHLVQCKWSGKKQMTVKKEDLVQLRVNAAKIGKIPVFMFGIGDETWAALPVDRETFKRLSEEQ